ncbi:MAG: 50S ribosomal protein L29 [candidate division CPR1 bacterium GW2011_GWA2_42_17]|uniref:Large ribosomal subunit protein uL29 n=1 Tax=candidate division CPR1 bacterium GW2011_GWA2_42_17 TaxID=1618341 RepID=A0A0G1BC24_9BACT|nr:MAG: 50S ribosomal protein L29 [candidate division CPR1 bacterium GW2011_GWA2_42_17]
MAKNKEILKNLKSKTVEELQLEKIEAIKKLARLKLEKGVSRLKKVSDLIKEKKLLAQILTIIKESQKNV